jgi:DNA polymerase
VNAANLRDGEFDSDHIGPWTRWLGDLRARVLVVGQDWGAQRTLANQNGRDVATGYTNRMLRALLASVGIQVPDVCVTSVPYGVFLTNAVLCFKDGGDQAPVRGEWFDTCGSRFLRPQIDLIRPRVVVGLGERAYRTILSAYGRRAPATWRTAVDGPGVPLDGGPIAFAVYHCSKRGQMYRNRDAQLKDWQRIAAALADDDTEEPTHCGRNGPYERTPDGRADVPWTKRQEIPDPQILDAADQYERARQLLATNPPGTGVLLPLMNAAAVAIELYLKCLSAELVHVRDESAGDVSRVYARPAITGSKGHRLVDLFDALPEDLRLPLVATFEAELRSKLGIGLRLLLSRLEGAFMSTRYPFESGIDISRYELGHLMNLSQFLQRFVHALPPKSRITWKDGRAT